MEPMKMVKEHLRQGMIFDGAMQMYPSRLIGFAGGVQRESEESQHSFVFVVDGTIDLQVAQGGFQLCKGMYASVPGRFEISGSGQAALFQRLGFRGLFHLGGPVEQQGRLTYIDCCTTTLIAPPARDGDPCLNLLCFPPNIKQTPHIHPTLRLGVVAGGFGVCKDQSGDDVRLEPGDVFVLNPGYRHCFHSSESGLVVIAYHPDSEGGPTDESHPMLNRTFTQF